MPKHSDWIFFSQSDLAAAKKLVEENDTVLFAPATYHTQQCAEKALKAYIVYLKKPLKRTHDLSDLIKFCMQFDQEFESLKEYAANLTPFVTESRYPDDCFEIPDLETVKIAIQQADHILNFVKDKIESD